LKDKVRGRQYNLLSFPGNWQWHDLVAKEWSSPEVEQLRLNHPETMEWLDMLPHLKSNYISVQFPDGENPSIFGSMVYSKDSTKINGERGVQQCYYFVYKDTLITINLDDQTWETMNKTNRMIMLQHCQQAIEGLFVISRTILHYLHEGMDRYECNLRELEHQMERNNHRYLMDEILDSRYELLFWNNLFISFQELVVASNEAFHEEIKDNRFYNQLFHRVDRMERLFVHYNNEIDTLISIDNAVSAFRGNEIMKTLTILTAVFMPATVIGAIWGMNFDVIPFSKMSWGFVGMIVMIGVTTTIMYFWMRKKGWTGDLLKVNSKEKHL
jgi:magnesium transporter